MKWKDNHRNERQKQNPSGFCFVFLADSVIAFLLPKMLFFSVIKGEVWLI